MLRCVASAVSRPARAAAVLRPALHPTSNATSARHWSGATFLATRTLASKATCPPIVWTITDEAPALATQSLLPVVQAFSRKAGIAVETRDISLSSAYTQLSSLVAALYVAHNLALTATCPLVHVVWVVWIVTRSHGTRAQLLGSDLGVCERGVVMH